MNYEIHVVRHGALLFVCMVSVGRHFDCDLFQEPRSLTFISSLFIQVLSFEQCFILFQVFGMLFR